ncbi:unnamed protein product [Closterium sp. Naga37s-1]|nr:unnamed protein product [Closterium sp. Naga37s-1]
MAHHTYLGLSVVLLVVAACFATTTARPVNDRNGGKDVKGGGPPDAGPCPLPKPIEAEALGNLTAGEPFAVPMWKGAAGERGQAVAAIVAAGATWENLTRPLPPPPKAKKNKKTPPAPPPPKYTYALNGTWLNASTLTAYDGQTIMQLVDTIIAKPDENYAKLETYAYESGAARGQFKSEPLPPPQKDKKGGKNGGKNGGGKNGGDQFGTLVGAVGTRLNGSNADLTGDVNATGCISLVVFLSPLTLSTSPHFSHLCFFFVFLSPTVTIDPPYPPVPRLNTRPSPPLPAPPYPSLPLPSPPCPSLPFPTLPCPSLPLLAPPCPSLPLLDPPCPSLPLPAPPCPSLPLLDPPCPSLPLPATHPLSNTTTNDYDIRFHVSVSLNDSGEPTGVVIKKGADVALSVVPSSATWTNRTLSAAERAKLGGKVNPKGKKGKQPPPPPPPPLGYTYETTGTWLSASTLTADNGQTYKELVDAMLAAPDAYSALVYTRTFENGAAFGALTKLTKGGQESGILSIKTRVH